MPPLTQPGRGSGDDAKPSPSPRPTSWSLSAPRSASVQQLVSKWEGQPGPSPSPSSPSPTISTLAAPSDLASFVTAGSSQAATTSAPAHRALLADPVNAVNGTPGPLDWTPKYGLSNARTSRSPIPQDIAQPAAPSPRSTPPSFSPVIPARASPTRHLVPLRSVQPTHTIPSSASPLSGPDVNALPPPLPLASPSAFSPAPNRNTVTLQSTPDKPPPTRRKTLNHDDSIPAPNDLANRLADLVPSLHDQQAKPPRREASKQPSSLQASSLATVGTQRTTSFNIVAEEVALCPQMPSKHSSRPSLKLQTSSEQLATNNRLRDSSKAPAPIFDLDAKAQLDSQKYLPSSFRRTIPEHVAPIPERSSSHLTSSQECWSSEDPTSILLLPTLPYTNKGQLNHPKAAEAEQWKSQITDKIVRDADDSDLDSETLPTSADDVFKRDAAPIYLPALEEYLKNPIIFGEPLFSHSRTVCTEQEIELFELDDNVTFDTLAQSVPFAHGASPSPSSSHIHKRRTGSKLSSRLAQLEVAGGQINCPASLYSSSVDSRSGSRKDSSLRRRNAAPVAKQQPHASSASNSSKRSKIKGSKKSTSEEFDPLLQADDGNERKLQDDEDGRYANGAYAIGVKEGLDLDSDDDATLVAEDAIEAEKVASRILSRLTASQQSGSRGSAVTDPLDEGVSSKFSTRSNPITRRDMFPPLMLLKDNSLDELKSNAIGPRKPPGGIWAVKWLGIIFDMVIGVEGSTFAAGILRLETLRDLFQMMTIQLHFQRYFESSDPSSASGKFFKFLLQTVPAILGLDLVSVFGYAVIFFVVWVIITAMCLWQFWRMTRAPNPNKHVEGFDSQGWIYKSAPRGTRFANTLLVFILGLMYLPLSKVAVDALVWSSDFWPVPNPYLGGVDQAYPDLLTGDPDVWRKPLDFCYTTTMRKDAFNWAWVILPLAVLTIMFYTLWYPYRLMMSIKELLPRVSPYNELGEKRSEQEMQIYYHRLLNRDKSPFNFLYNSYHRRWGYYKPLYILLFKLTNLVIIGVLAKDNCLFRSFPTRTMLVVQQVALIVVMSALLGIHLWIKPFVDKSGNRSELVSRIGYVLTAAIGLLVALNVDGSTVYNTTILYGIQAFTYGGNIYFALIGMSFVAHQVKRWQNRVDYTIDLFSPVLDISKHIKRRVWEETLSILILCGREYHMPLEQTIAFSMSEEDYWPPYLIDFQGSVAERHIENLKILKHIGIDAYRREIDHCRKAEGIYRQKLIRTIQRDYAGLDAYWRPLEPPFPSGVMSFFGKAFMVPFPPTLVIRYDEGTSHSVSLTRTAEFEAFIEQNSDPKIVGKKMIRQTLRALEGQKVFCPFTDNVQVGDTTSGLPFVDKVFGQISEQRRTVPRFGALPGTNGISEYVLATPISYTEGVIRIERRNEFDWADYNFSSGFEVTIVYEEGKMKDVGGKIKTKKRELHISGSRAFGLTEDFSMNPSLARFFKENEQLILRRAPLVEKVLRRYRRDFEREARWKERVLPYSFLTDVFDNDGLSPYGLRMALVDTGCGRSMRNLPILYEGCVTLMYERLAAINRSPVHRFWWILFDEIWRLNSNDYKLLRKFRRSFSPQYPTSIAYRPMPREALERFLAKRGLWKKNGATGGPFNRGLLNRIYFYLNEIVFASKRNGHRFGDTFDSHIRQAATIKVGLGHSPTETNRRNFSSVDDDEQLSPSSILNNPSIGSVRKVQGGEKWWEKPAQQTSGTPSHFTGGGTAYSTDSVIVRTAYRWEQRLDGYKTDTVWQRFKMRSLQWLSLHPVVVKMDRKQLYLYLKLVEVPREDGKAGTEKRYELMKPGSGHLAKFRRQEGEARRIDRERHR